MSKRTEAEIIRDLQRIECALSPENLHCDGEITRAQARTKERALVAQRSKLVKELGREPSDSEIWNYQASWA
jgi:hypothetical protein